jgi:hypothetical protein
MIFVFKYHFRLVYSNVLNNIYNKKKKEEATKTRINKYIMLF